MQSAPPITINLSGKPRERLENIFLSWAAQAGKIIIIVTELVALGALSYRFIIDRQIIDLNDQIRTKLLFVNSQTQKENVFRDIQNRLFYVKLLTDESHTKLIVLADILSAAKSGGVEITNLLLNEDKITLSGNTSSLFSIHTFVNTFKARPGVSAISIDEIESGESGVHFKLTMTLTNNKKL